MAGVCLQSAAEPGASRAVDAELAVVRQELQQARDDNAALLRRLVKQREGAQIQLECTVAFWMERVAAIEAGKGQLGD